MEVAGFDVAFDGFEAFDDLVALGVGDELNFGEHGGVGDGAGDVVLIEAAVVADGFDEGLGEGVGGLADAGLP